MLTILPSRFVARGGASMFTLIRSIQTPNAEDAEDAEVRGIQMLGLADNG